MLNEPCLSSVHPWVHLLPQASGLGMPAFPKAAEPHTGEAALALLVLLRAPTLLQTARGCLLRGPGSWPAMPSQVQAALRSGQEPWL